VTRPTDVLGAEEPRQAAAWPRTNGWELARLTSSARCSRNPRCLG